MHFYCFLYKINGHVTIALKYTCMKILFNISTTSCYFFKHKTHFNIKILLFNFLLLGQIKT